MTDDLDNELPPEPDWEPAVNVLADSMGEKLPPVMDEWVIDSFIILCQNPECEIGHHPVVTVRFANVAGGTGEFTTDLLNLRMFMHDLLEAGNIAFLRAVEAANIDMEGDDD